MFGYLNCECASYFIHLISWKTPSWFASLLREISRVSTALPHILMHNARVREVCLMFLFPTKNLALMIQCSCGIALFCVHWDKVFFMKNWKKKKERRRAGEGVRKLGWVKLRPGAIVNPRWYPYGRSLSLARFPHMHTSEPPLLKQTHPLHSERWIRSRIRIDHQIFISEQQWFWQCAHPFDSTRLLQYLLE